MHLVNVDMRGSALYYCNDSSHGTSRLDMKDYPADAPRVKCACGCGGKARPVTLTLRGDAFYATCDVKVGHVLSWQYQGGFWAGR